MASVNISSYSGSVSGGNWKPAFEAAWAAIKANGGKINLDTQSMKLTTGLTFAPDSGFQVPLILQGDGSNRIQIDGASGASILNSGNLTSLTYRDLIIHGTPANYPTPEAGFVVTGQYTYLTTIDNCLLAGLQSNTSIVRFGTNSSLNLINSSLGGNAANSVVLLDGGNRLMVNNCEFADYQNILDVYHSKTPFGVGAWIKCINPPANNGATFGRVQVSDCLFDEGAGNAVEVDGYPRVEIERCAVNVNGGGYGFKLSNVEQAIIKQCNTGYTAIDAPVMKLINCGNVVVIGQSIDHGPFRIEKDSATNVILLESPGVSVVTV